MARCPFRCSQLLLEVPRHPFSRRLGSFPLLPHHETKLDLWQLLAPNSEWDEASSCQCKEHHWTGTVGDVWEDVCPTGEKRVPVTRLAKVKRRLKTQLCPVVWSDRIRYLLGRLRTSEKQVQEQTEPIVPLH